MALKKFGKAFMMRLLTRGNVDSRKEPIEIEKFASKRKVSLITVKAGANEEQELWSILPELTPNESPAVQKSEL